LQKKSSAKGKKRFDFPESWDETCEIKKKEETTPGGRLGVEKTRKAEKVLGKKGKKGEKKKDVRGERREGLAYSEGDGNGGYGEDKKNGLAGEELLLTNLKKPPKKFSGSRRGGPAWP